MINFCQSICKFLQQLTAVRPKDRIRIVSWSQIQPMSKSRSRAPQSSSQFSGCRILKNSSACFPYLLQRRRWVASLFPSSAHEISLLSKHPSSPTPTLYAAQIPYGLISDPYPLPRSSSSSFTPRRPSLFQSTAAASNGRGCLFVFAWYVVILLLGLPKPVPERRV